MSIFNNFSNARAIKNKNEIIESESPVRVPLYLGMVKVCLGLFPASKVGSLTSMRCFDGSLDDTDAAADTVVVVAVDIDADVSS